MWTVNVLVCNALANHRGGRFFYVTLKINLGCAMVENDEFTGMRKLLYC